MRSTTFTSRSSGRRAIGAVAVLAVAAMVLMACGDDEGAGPTAILRAPEDGALVSGGLAVDMMASGLTIEAAGEVRDGAGHFHVIVDDGCLDAGTTVPKDAKHVHFGSGAATGTIYLAPGQHELCLQVADGEHRALGITDTATVTVAITSQDECCDAIAEVDVMFTQADTAGEDFAIRQVTYGNVVRLLAQLTAGLDAIDADARDTVGAAVDTASHIAAAFANAADEPAAGEALAELYGVAGADTMTEAAPWINATCDVEIDG